MNSSKENAKVNPRAKIEPINNIPYILLAAGLIFLCLALLHNHNVSALIGIALTFWGAVLLYAGKSEYVNKDVFDNSFLGSNDSLSSFIDRMNYSGIPTYTSPKTLSTYSDVYIVITKSASQSLPSDEQLAQKKQFLEDPPSIILPPPGSKLLGYIQNEMEIDLFSTHIEELGKILETIIVNKLEMSREINVENKGQIISLQLKDSIFNTITSSIKNDEILRYFGDPLTSLIACIIVLATHRNTRIKSIDINNEENSIKIDYELL